MPGLTAQPHELPISVVVAVLNGRHTIARCIESIARQDQPCELIVMDGGSTDGTVSVLKENSGDIDYWETAVDKGIYDAWNKALDRARGEWICFLGADDYFSTRESLSFLARHADASKFNFVSSRVAWVNQSEKVVRVVGEPWNWERMKIHQVIAHPGALHHRSLFQKVGKFDTRYQIAGDYDFLLRAGRTIAANYTDAVTVCMGIHGASLTDVRRALRETRRIQVVHPEIGLHRANANFLIAHGKHVVGKVISWFH
jgi:glycosyltransferase involved in cell wall biosynthesis